MTMRREKPGGERLSLNENGTAAEFQVMTDAWGRYPLLRSEDEIRWNRVDSPYVAGFFFRRNHDQGNISGRIGKRI